MSNLNDRVKSIHEKAKHIVSRLDKLDIENNDLKDTIVKLTTENKEKEALLTSLKNKLETMEEDGRNDLNKESIQQKLNQYSEEIDACIELANELVL